MTVKSLLVLPAIVAVIATAAFADPMTNHKMMGHTMMHHPMAHVGVVVGKKHHKHHMMGKPMHHAMMTKPMHHGMMTKPMGTMHLK